MKLRHGTVPYSTVQYCTPPSALHEQESVEGCKSIESLFSTGRWQRTAGVGCSHSVLQFPKWAVSPGLQRCWAKSSAVACYAYLIIVSAGTVPAPFISQVSG